MIAAVSPDAVSLKAIPVVCADDRAIVCKQPHNGGGMGTIHRVYCASCGRQAMTAAQRIGAMAETQCTRFTCRANVRYEVDDRAVTVTTTRRDP